MHPYSLHLHRASISLQLSYLCAMWPTLDTHGIKGQAKHISMSEHTNMSFIFFTTYKLNHSTYIRWLLAVIMIYNAAICHVKHNKVILQNCVESFMIPQYVSLNCFFFFVLTSCSLNTSPCLRWVTEAELDSPHQHSPVPPSSCWIKGKLILSDANGSQWRPWGTSANVLEQLT